jgi:hypothetical protein
MIACNALIGRCLHAGGPAIEIAATIAKPTFVDYALK